VDLYYIVDSLGNELLEETYYDNSETLYLLWIDRDGYLDYIDTDGRLERGWIPGYGPMSLRGISPSRELPSRGAISVWTLVPGALSTLRTIGCGTWACPLPGSRPRDLP